MGKSKSEDALQKKRERDRRRREKIKKDPELYRKFRGKERARYQKRKQEKKALPISELPPHKQKILRQRNREGFRAHYQRLKAKKLETIEEVESEPEITLPELNEQSQKKNDPLTSSPAPETSRYSLRSGRHQIKGQSSSEKDSTNNTPMKRKLEMVSEQEAQPGPSSTVTALGTSLDSNASREQDPLSGTIEQCRFCGEFSKDCIAVSGSMPYLAANKTTLALNDTSVQLDFNNHSLPSTVCRDCDSKLQEIADFLTVVKAAQDTLINVAEEIEVGETGVEFEVVRPDVTEETETETLVIKTEYDSQDEESDYENEDKEDFVDPLTVGETIFVKKYATNKRKSDAVTAKPKKLKAKQCDSESMIDIKEEVIEKEDEQGQSGVSDSDVKPSELELATSALMFEMADEGTSEYQGYRSDR